MQHWKILLMNKKLNVVCPICAKGLHGKQQEAILSVY